MDRRVHADLIEVFKIVIIIIIIHTFLSRHKVVTSEAVKNTGKKAQRVLCSQSHRHAVKTKTYEKKKRKKKKKKKKKTETFFPAGQHRDNKRGDGYKA